MSGADKLAAQEKDREIELARIAAEEAKADKEREHEKDKLAAQEKDKEIELARIATEERLEMARIEGIAEQAERDRELKRTELETDRESKWSSKIELEKLKHSFELFCLLLGPPGFNCWFSSAPVFQWCCSTPQGSPGVGREHFCRPHLCFIIVFICDLFVSRDDPLMS